MTKRKTPRLPDDEVGFEIGFEPDAALGLKGDDPEVGLDVDRLETHAVVDGIEPMTDDDGNLRYHVVMRAELSEAAAKALFSYCVKRGRVRLEILPADGEESFELGP